MITPLLSVYFSEFFHRSIFLKFIFRIKWLIFFIVFVSILFVSAINNPYPLVGRSRKGTISMIIEGITGLKYFGITQLLFASIFVIFVLWLVFSFVNFELKKSKMIVGIEFDLINDQLTLYTKNLYDRTIKSVYKLSKTRVTDNSYRDVFSGKDGKCVTFVLGNRAIGRLYYNHFTWRNTNEVNEIRIKLSNK